MSFEGIVVSCEGIGRIRFMSILASISGLHEGKFWKA